MAFVNNQKPCLHSTYIVHEFVNLMVQLSVSKFVNLAYRLCKLVENRVNFNPYTLGLLIPHKQSFQLREYMIASLFQTSLWNKFMITCNKIVTFIL